MVGTGLAISFIQKGKSIPVSLWSVSNSDNSYDMSLCYSFFSEQYTILSECSKMLREKSRRSWESVRWASVFKLK